MTSSHITKLKINTVIGKTSLKYEGDILKRVLELPNFVLNKRAKVIFKKKKGITAVINKSGVIMIYGGKSQNDQMDILNSILDELNSYGIVVESTNIEICSIGISGRLKNINTLNLENAVEVLRAITKVEYEPEQFPAIIIKLKTPKCCVLLFANGSFVVQGIKTIKDGEKAINKLMKCLMNSKGVAIKGDISL